MVSSDVLMEKLEYLKRFDQDIISKALEPRIPGGLNDVLLIYYSQLMGDDEPAGLPPVDKLCLALDIVLRNHHVEYERRKHFIKELRELCQDQPELLLSSENNKGKIQKNGEIDAPICRG